MSTPVRITFSMRTPVVVPSVAKPLDAVLSWAAVQRSDFHGADDPIADQHSIGVEKHAVGGQWCFMASNLFYTFLDNHPAFIHYIKRQHIEAYTEAWMDGLLTKRPSFDSTSGLTKAGSYVAPIRWASEVQAYAMVENMARLQQLLPWVTHVGKLHHKDFGAVRSYTITEDTDAADFWVHRSLPVGSPFAGEHVPAIGGLVSPYWKRENHQQILMSVADFSLVSQQKNSSLPTA